MTMRIIWVLFAVFVLTGCALGTMNTGSFVEDVPEKDAGQIATRIAELTAARLSPGAKVKLVPGPGQSLASQEIAARLDEALRARGILVATAHEAVNGHELRYQVTHYGKNWLLRVHLDAVEASMVLTKGQNGQLSAATPLTIREAAR